MLTAAASTTCGCLSRVSSITVGSILWPPRMMMSLARPGDPEKAVGVDAAEIARVEPAVRQEDALVGRLIDIARRDARALHHHEADLVDAVLAHDVAGVVDVDDLDLRIRQAKAGRAVARIAVARRLRDVLGVLGGAIARQHAHAADLFELARDLGRKRRRSGDAIGTQRAQVRAAGRLLAELGQRGRHTREQRDAEFFDELPVVLDEALVARAARRRDHDFHAVGDRHDAATEEAGDMEHRIIGENHVVRRCAPSPACSPRICRRSRDA